MKISKKDIEPIERETAVISNYPFPTKEISITHIQVKGRHPSDVTKQHIEHKLTLICYVISGSGKFIVEELEIEVSPGDAIFIKSDQKYYIEGDLEYLVSCSPAYYREQHEQVVLENTGQR